MKKTCTGLVAAVIMVVWAGAACGAKSPVLLTHTLTGYSKGADKVSLEYVIEVQNEEETAISDVSLALVPSPPYVMTKQTVTVPKLAPKEKAEVKVQLFSRLLRDRSEFEGKPLRWAGTYTDAGGKVVLFPVRSKAGGGK